MIERLYLKNNLSFEEAELELQNGLIVFTGASGAGKSVLFEAILALFGIKEARADVAEVSVAKAMSLDEYGIESEEVNTFKQTKKDKVRYFINNQSVSKKSIYEIAGDFIKFLSLKDFSDFENSLLLESLDGFINLHEDSYGDTLAEFKEQYSKYIELERELEKINLEEQKVEELKEFVAFEIKKIEDVSPSVDEYEELSELKASISKKDKIIEALSKAEPLFDAEDSVISALALMGKESAMFVEVMNDVRATFEDEKLRLESIDEENIESVLDRIEAIASLVKKYGSVEECLAQLAIKKEELERYENISFEKSKIIKALESTKAEVERLSKVMSTKRSEASKAFETKANGYIKDLHLSGLEIAIVPTKLSSLGADEVVITLAGVALNKISSGEFNRVRLAMIATKSEISGADTGVLILDEIDANLSGVESESVAKVLKFLSQFYQIFSISHQPQLSSIAHQHFVVSKSDGVSTIREVRDEERVEEIARMISGTNISENARGFAKGLFDD